MTRHDGPFGHDWAPAPPRARRIGVNDETLRDGLQAATARLPSAEAALAFARALPALGIEALCVGMPSAGGGPAALARAVACGVAAERLPLALNAAARTTDADVAAVAALAQAAGIPVEIGLFIGASAARRQAEGWSLADVRRQAAAAIAAARREGLAVMFVTEDTARTDPATLLEILGAALDAGAARLCLTDTAGAATPAAARALVRFVREEVVGDRGGIALDWHGHRDRGLGLACALAAAESGVDRIHATALGAGERVGNVAMELLLANLRAEGWRRGALDGVGAYARAAAAALGREVPADQPLVGADAFRTGSGTHAAAIRKALRAGDGDTAARLYAWLDPREAGQALGVALTPLAGLASARWWLDAHGYDGADTPLAETLLAAAKAAPGPLDDATAHAVVARAQEEVPGVRG